MCLAIAAFSPALWATALSIASDVHKGAARKSEKKIEYIAMNSEKKIEYIAMKIGLQKSTERDYKWKLISNENWRRGDEENAKNGQRHRNTLAGITNIR